MAQATGRGIDVLVYTPAEFEQLRASRAFVKNEVIDRGLLLFERDGKSGSGDRLNSRQPLA